jgi:two-component system LytT family response regulator
MRVLIVDDELLARKRLHRLLDAMPDVEVVGELEDGAELPARLRENDVDLVLLDVQMREISGIEALGMIEEGPLIVFVTAHDRYAVDAFDGGAVDYLLKPVEPARLTRALARARERLRPKSAQSRIGVPTRKGLMLFEPAEILYALIDGETVTLHTERGSYVIDFRIAELEKRLGEGFERVHRRALVNLSRVVLLTPNEVGGYTAHVEGGGEVPVSRSAARRLRKLWDLPRG